jgi:hypothetical protein
MKTLIKSILVVAVMFGTYTGYASETLDKTPYNKTINKGDNIVVRSSKGDIIFKGSVNYDGNLTQLLNFSQLSDDTYTIEITKDFEIEVIDLIVKDQTVELLIESQEKIFKPVFRTKEGQLIISKIAFDSNVMNVKLYYDGELIFSENVKEEAEILNRVYRLDETNPGTYKAVIKTNDRVYTENFRI